MSEEIESTTEPKSRLKESDWIVVVALWERGEVTLSELSTKFGVSKAALSQGLKRRKAVRGSKAHIATKKIQEKIESEKEKLVEDIYNFKKRFIGYGTYLADQTMQTIREAKAPGGKGVENTRGELMAYGEASKIISKVRDDLYYLYDLYDKDAVQGDNYDFNVGVYSPDDIKDLREAQKFIEALEAREPDDDDVVEGMDDEAPEDDGEDV